MSKVLIIGNGFDIYHKLPTRYLDFLFFAQNWEKFKEAYDKAEPDGRDEKGALIEVPLGPKNELTIESLYEFGKYRGRFPCDHIDYLNENIQTNAWYAFFTRIKPVGAKWIDFETEIYKALKQVEEYYDLLPTLCNGRTVPNLVMPEYMRIVIYVFSKKTEELGNGYQNLAKGVLTKDAVEPEKLRNNKQALLSQMKADLNVFNRCLNYYIADFVCLMKSRVYSEQIKALSDVLLLNFNYTYTYSMVYGKTRMKTHHPVHGEAKEENLVLGISDDSFPDTLDYVYFQKYFQRIQKRTGSFYRDWIDYPDGPIEVFIMGHSLSKVDKGILQGFFENDNIEKVTIYYHSQQSYEDMVINLVDMFDKDFVIEKTGSGFIKFEQLEPEVYGNAHTSSD